MCVCVCVCMCVCVCVCACMRVCVVSVPDRSPLSFIVWMGGFPTAHIIKNRIDLSETKTMCACVCMRTCVCSGVARIAL